VRILVDYRPALRERTGVGEYVHALAAALAGSGTDEIGLFTSSWADRPPGDLASRLQVRVVDRRIPVRLLNRMWHRHEWPPVEWLAGRWDVVHAVHPLLIPTRSAAGLVTIHDLFFLERPSGVGSEIAADYPRLAASHARRADAVITPSHHVRRQVIERLAVPPDRVHVVSPGPPRWTHLGHGPHLPDTGYVLFLGTLEHRKNIVGLLEAWPGVLARIPHATLTLAGRATPESTPWLQRLSTPPFQGSVRHLGYVPDADRESLFAGARLLVLPSLDEGFGLPVLEAMSAGIPVVATTRGAVPEVSAGAAALVDPTDPEALTNAIVTTLQEPVRAHAMAERGLARAASFSWAQAAESARDAYRHAVQRAARRGTPA